MEKKRDRTIIKIQEDVAFCEKQLKKLFSLTDDKEVYNIGPFEAMLSQSQQDLASVFEFWKSDWEDGHFIRIISNGTLVMFQKDQGSVIHDNVGLLTIEDYIEQSSSESPAFVLTWTGEVPNKGTLISVKVDFGSYFVVYSFNFRSGKYDVYNPQKMDLRSIGLPKNLKEADEILGVPFKRVIDFDEKTNALLKASALDEIVEEISSRAPT
ncbi:MAG: hypothetical protein KAS78_03490 [Candidatus Pacebacteria bacterium]|nr:hypothetical protein [Candidatus Paceibacterota bacterium]